MTIQHWITFLFVGALVILPALTVMAQGRDADGTRMQARQVELGSTHNDSLSPPQDRADWRMIRINESHQLRLTAAVTGGELTLTLTNSSGDIIESSSARDGQSAEITRRLEPGIYYISAESREALRYRLEIR